MKKSVFFLLLILLCATNSYSQKLSDTKQIISTFFDKYEKKSSADALDFLFSSNKYIKSEEISPLKKRIKQYQGLLGEYSGYELLIKQDVGKSIVVYSYIIKYDRQPLRFIFTFYKANNKWKIFNFMISDEFITEIEKEVIKLSYNK
jgi:hypothetical protein